MKYIILKMISITQYANAVYVHMNRIVFCLIICKMQSQTKLSVFMNEMAADDADAEATANGGGGSEKKYNYN